MKRPRNPSVLPQGRKRSEVEESGRVEREEEEEKNVFV